MYSDLIARSQMKSAARKVREQQEEEAFQQRRLGRKAMRQGVKLRESAMERMARLLGVTMDVLKTRRHG